MFSLQVAQSEPVKTQNRWEALQEEEWIPDAPRLRKDIPPQGERTGEGRHEKPDEEECHED